ncbi:MAG TPA: sulfur transferase domain-containing protein [Xanthomonadales bacterium]|nr:sulfur transferase domain-containing protein [Xanthomonadales bacterium]
MKYINKKSQSTPVDCLWVMMLLAVVLSLSLPAIAEEKAGTWGEDTKVIQYDRFFIAGQPDEAALEEANKNGINLVISLRSESELDWDESSAAESIGLSYYQVPVNARSQSLAEGPFDRINEIVEANPDAKIMVHCGSGNRAAAWLAVYLSEVQHMAPDDAIDVAKSSGLTKKGLEEKVRTYLNP